ncbi:aminotransferase-like domain-containing protein [Chitinimonas lacunae]|uniref:Putative 8-amino-7-oxononanoate synthase n=1 Tax=Chitinimonas lacunae TaxID=1963018 RepID=A0ABV8MU99_9NEIS
MSLPRPLGMIAFPALQESPLNSPKCDRLVATLQQEIAPLHPGHRLPSIRQVAEQHQVSKTVAELAYHRLVARGMVEVRHGIGFFVSGGRSAPEPALRLPTPVVIDYIQGTGSGLRLSSGFLPSEWTLSSTVERELRALLRRPQGIGYGHATDPRGYLPLRDTLRDHMAERGIAIAPEGMLLSQGGRQALDLICRSLVQPGQAVAVDSPSYYNLNSLLRLYGVEAHPIPRRHDGPDLERLEQVFRSGRVRLFFTSSRHHNPTGTDMTPAVAARVVVLAERYDVQLIEDDCLGGFKAMSQPDLLTLAGPERVIYLGSFSKTITSAFRFGYLASSPATIAQVLRSKVDIGLFTPEFHDKVIHAVLLSGHYARTLERLREGIRRAFHLALARLDQLGFEQYSRDSEALFLWARHPAHPDSRVLAETLARRRISIAPGYLFDTEAAVSPWLRFNAIEIASAPMELLRQAFAPSSSLPGSFWTETPSIATPDREISD